MKRSWTALAVALLAIFAVASCNDYGNTFQNNTGAALSFLSPSQVSAGSGDFTLTLRGSGFVLKTVVQWNGKPLATTVPVDSTGAALGNIVTATVPAAMVAKPGVATLQSHRLPHQSATESFAGSHWHQPRECDGMHRVGMHRAIHLDAQWFSFSPHYGSLRRIPSEVEHRGDAKTINYPSRVNL